MLWRTIEETKVLKLGGKSVGVGNIRKRSYEDSRGRIRQGPVATVVVAEAGMRLDEESLQEKVYEVDPGCVLDLGGEGRWKVVSIREGRGGGNGRIRIRRTFF